MSETMQDSGVEWIGEIPIGWKVDSLKRLLDEPLKYGANEAAELDDRELPRYIRITDFNHDGLLKDDSFKSLPLEKAAGYYLKNGDVLFARSGATVGKTFIFYGEDKSACFAGYLIKASTNRHLLSPEFLYFYTKSPAYDMWKSSIFTQATIQNIGADKYAYLPIIMPPIFEQQAIAQYLYERCGKLDSIIAIKKQQIQTLDALRQSIIYQAVTKGLDDSVELVDSGVEWLGEIPRGWKVSKLRYEITIKNGDFISNRLDDEAEYPVVGGNGFMGRTDNFNVKGDIIVIGRVGAYCGNVHYICEKSWVSDNALIVDTENNKRFFVYLLNSFGLNSIANKTAQPVVTATNIKAVYIPKPSLSEQQKIVDYLDDETQRLAQLKANLTQQIGVLLDYKKSLIYECVTGKKRV